MSGKKISKRSISRNWLPQGRRYLHVLQVDAYPICGAPPNYVKITDLAWAKVECGSLPNIDLLMITRRSNLLENVGAMKNSGSLLTIVG